MASSPILVLDLHNDRELTEMRMCMRAQLQGLNQAWPFNSDPNSNCITLETKLAHAVMSAMGLIWTEKNKKQKQNKQKKKKTLTWRDPGSGTPLESVVFRLRQHLQSFIIWQVGSENILPVSTWWSPTDPVDTFYF